MPNHIFRNQSSAERLRIASTGNVGIGTSTPSMLLSVNGTAGGTQSWQVTSDARLKTNVVPVRGALDMVTNLNPVRYDWLASSNRSVGKKLNLPVGQGQIGFLAQEVEKVVPEAVVRPGLEPDATYSIKEAALIPILVAAIKEQQVLLQALLAEVATLKARQ